VIGGLLHLPSNRGGSQRRGRHIHLQFPETLRAAGPAHEVESHCQPEQQL